MPNESLFYVEAFVSRVGRLFPIESNLTTAHAPPRTNLEFYHLGLLCSMWYFLATAMIAASLPQTTLLIIQVDHLPPNAQVHKSHLGYFYSSIYSPMSHL